MKNITQLSAGYVNSSAIAEGKLEVWGSLFTAGGLPWPNDLVKVSMLRNGAYHSCALDQNKVRCWGSGPEGMDPVQPMA